MRVLLLCAVLLLGASLSGCGTFAAETGPAGIDRLTVPTPSPDPADFAAVVDNPWLALRPGTTREYDDSAGATLTLTVLPDIVEVAGLTATAVRIETGATAAVDYYAQDTAGNVWWVGHDGPDRWRAGEGGAQAGLAMAAVPRRGDGYRPAYVPGGVPLLSTVTEAPDSPAGRGDGDEDVSAESGVVIETDGVTDTYVRGTGLVERVSGATRWEIR